MSLLNRNDYRLFFGTILLTFAFIPASFASGGFSGDFSPAYWSKGENPQKNLIDTSNAPFYVTIKNYTGWQVSGAGMVYERSHNEGTFSFDYSVSGGSQATCPASIKVGETVTLLPRAGGGAWTTT